MNLIFVDFDGVLNSTNENFKPVNESSNNNITFQRNFHVNQLNLDNLKILTENTGSSLIISSTWRKDKNFIESAKSEKEIIQKFTDLFALHGWVNAPIKGITPNLSGFRGEEVATYLDIIDSIFNENISYIILDDDTDFLLSSLSNLSPGKLDRLGIRNEESVKMKSQYWSNQKLFKINSATGLTALDIEIIENLFDIAQRTVKPLKVRV